MLLRPTSVAAVVVSTYYVVTSLLIFWKSAEWQRRPKEPSEGLDGDLPKPPQLRRRLSFFERLQKSLDNPFFSPCWYCKLSQRLQMAVLGPLLVPVRFTCGFLAVFTASLIANTMVYGLPKDKFTNRTAAPIRGWRRMLMLPLRCCGRAFLFSMGYHWIETSGKQAPREAAPIIVANHVCALEPFLIGYASGGMPVSRIENIKIPFFGAIAKAFQCIFVDRTDPDSRRAVSQEIQRRATEDGWNQIMLFPEGTCSNGRAVITFKAGAFYPRVPVQPVAVNYPFSPGAFHPGWVVAGPGPLECFFRMCCQIHNRMQVTWLPPVAPEPDEMPPAHPRQFASRVQGMIASSLRVPATEHSYEDVQLMLEAVKLSGDPAGAFATNVAAVELQHLRRFINIEFEDAKGYLAHFRQRNISSSGSLNLEEFKELFGQGISTPVLQRLFDMLDADGDGRLNFREYLIGAALFNAKDIDTINAAFKLAFHLYDLDESGTLNFEEAKAILTAVYPNGDLRTAFDQIDVNHDGVLNQEEFLRWAKTLDSYQDIRNRLFGMTSLEGEASQAGSHEAGAR